MVKVIFRHTTSFENIINVLEKITKNTDCGKIPQNSEMNNQFDYIISSIYYMQDKSHSNKELQIGEIISIIISTFNRMQTPFLKRSSYLNLNKILVKLDCRRVDYKIETQVLDIMTMLMMNSTEYKDTIHKYYATLIVRKLILYYDITSNQNIIEELLEFADMIIESIKKFSNSLSHTLAQIEDSIRHNYIPSKLSSAMQDKNKKEMEKTYIILILESFIILYKFKDLHTKFVDSLVLESIVYCAQKINDVSKKLTDPNDSIFGVYFTPQEVIYINRIVSLIIYEASYFSDTYDDLLSREVIQYMIHQLANPLKSIHTSISNALMNTFAIGNANFIPVILEEINSYLDELNESIISHKLNDSTWTLIPMIAMLDFFYEKVVKEIGKENQFAIDELHNIVILLTNAYAEKFSIDLPKSILTKMLEQADRNLYIRARVFVLLIRQMKQHKLNQLTDNQRENILELITKMIKKDLAALLTKHVEELSEFGTLIHDKFLEDLLRKGIPYLNDASSLDNIYFWEYYSEQLK